MLKLDTFCYFAAILKWRVGNKFIVFFLAASVLFLGVNPALAASFNYSAISSTPIPDNQPTCAAVATRSINVSNNFTINDLNVGLVIPHTYRSDLKIDLTSPNSTSVTLINGAGPAGDPDFNVRLDDAAATSIGDVGHDASASYPEFTRQPQGALSAFNGEDANGIWTLTVCDEFDVDTGTLEAFYLEFDGTASSGGGGGAAVYSEAFTNGVTYAAGSTQFDNWDPFRLGLPTSGIQSITINGSRDTTGRTCSDPALAQQIADNLRTSPGTGANGATPETSLSCNGFFWNTGQCAVSGTGIEFNAGAAASICTDSGNYSLRPRIGNSNWGGINGTSLNAPTQTMSVSYSTTGASPLIVTSTADTNTLGTLRFAINHANANAADDDITFNISGAGPHRITLASKLPIVSDSEMSIDGTTQPGASCGQLTTGTPHTLMVEIDGDGIADHIFEITASDVTISGLAVGNSDGKGFFMRPTGDDARIECNYWGVWADGVTSAPLVTNNGLADANQVEGADNATITNNLFSGNDDDIGDLGLTLTDSDGAVVVGNIIGLNAEGTASIPNIGAGLVISNSSNTVIGGTTAALRNIISGNGANGLTIQNGASNIAVLNNYVGVGVDGTTSLGNLGQGITVNGASNISIGNGASSGRNIISSNAQNGLFISNSSTSSVVGNYIGVASDGTTARGNAFSGMAVDSSASIEIGGINSSDGNVIADSQAGSGIFIYGASNDISVEGNSIGTSANGTIALGNTHAGVWVQNTSSVVVGGALPETANSIKNNGYSGLVIGDTAQVSVLGNSISSNASLGIDLFFNGVTSNDSGDIDSGPNNLLNFPVINALTAYGTTTVDYDINLDVPSDVNGYRIDFYKNSVQETNGEGEIHLGSVDVASAGGDLNFTGSFTANVAVSDGDFISATTTRKTGASTYDITSEFSLTATAEGDASLIASESLAPLIPGEYMLPGKDVIYSYLVTNEGVGSVSPDSIVLIAAVPPETTFFLGDHDGPGPSADVIGFDETATTLTFDPSVDAQFSDSLTKPADLMGCAYTPVSGYDPNVKFICLNPKGAMAGGDPNPNFALRFRARIN